MTGRRLLIGVVAVAALAIGYFSMTDNWPPVFRGGDATITKAPRDIDDQISKDDVVLTDADIQDFMQTDFFHALVVDEEFRKMVIDGTMDRFA